MKANDVWIHQYTVTICSQRAFTYIAKWIFDQFSKESWTFQKSWILNIISLIDQKREITLEKICVINQVIIEAPVTPGL